MSFLWNKSKHSKAENVQINLNGCSIPNAEKYEYLGVVMDKNLNLTEHLEQMIKKASSRVKLLSRIQEVYLSISLLFSFIFLAWLFSLDSKLVKYKAIRCLLLSLCLAL